MGASIEIETAVYTAFRGYSWSRIPGSVGKDRMDMLYGMAAETRGEFPSPEAVDVGVVSDGVFAAAFSIFTAPDWDVEGRSAEYAAFAFVPCADAASVDFAALLRDAFFRVPTHEPPLSITYYVPVSALRRREASLRSMGIGAEGGSSGSAEIAVCRLRKAGPGALVRIRKDDGNGEAGSCRVRGKRQDGVHVRPCRLLPPKRGTRRMPRSR